MLKEGRRAGIDPPGWARVLRQFVCVRSGGAAGDRQAPHQLLHQIVLHVAVEQIFFLFLAEYLAIVEGVFAPCLQYRL